MAMENIDPEIQSMIPAYMERRRLDLSTLEESVSNGNYGAIASIAHQIKGHAASFGFDDLESIAVDLESAALLKNESSCRTIVGYFADWLRANS